jgi:hypothetical protein
METLTTPQALDFTTVTFAYGYSTDEPLFFNIPRRGQGYGTWFKAKHTGGKCYVTGSGQSYDVLSPELRQQAPVVRYDLTAPEAPYWTYKFRDSEYPAIKNPGYYGNTVRGFLELLAALGVPVEYPTGWNWEAYQLEK